MRTIKTYSNRAPFYNAFIGTNSEAVVPSFRNLQVEFELEALASGALSCRHLRVECSASLR